MRWIATIIRVPAYLMPVLFFVSCGSYNRKIQQYYSAMDAGRYKAAYHSLDRIKFLDRPRNRFLYYAEKGRMAQLMGMYDTSNHLLDEADRIAETRFKNAGDILAGNLLNPMMETYHGEPFERLMLNYYKALNYCALGDMENALVEARRITLAINDQMEDKKEKTNRYSRDAFSLNLQGMLYEASGDINNAFIAYRNAVETYLSQDNRSWYGVSIPLQLQKDLLRTATQNGFIGERERFEKLMGYNYQPEARPEGGELVLFLENGKAPVKEEENLMFALVKGAGGFFFTDPFGSMNIPFDMSPYNRNNVDIGDLRTFRVALPKYAVVSSRSASAQVSVNGKSFSSELAEDINTIALQTMRENRLNDITAALTRLLVKKLAEAGARAAGKAAVKKDDKASDAEKKKKEEDAEAVGAAVGLIFQAFSLLSEKADTRNWQSLPAYIQYVRIPLQKGINRISISNGGQGTQEIEVNGTGRLQLMNIR